MKIITLNVNGIRSAATKGLFEWLALQQPDVVCLQETKAQEHQLPPEKYHLPGYHCYFHDAEKKGYSGVAIFARHRPERVVAGVGVPEFDREGRYLQADFGSLSVISLYLPSGSSGPQRQIVKYQFMEIFFGVLQRLQKDGRHYVICGDWNIAHQPIDLKNWRANQKNSGFLPEERQWLDQVFGLGWVDAFRVIEAAPDHYTWWSNRGQAWAKNVGWRIDYQVTTPGLRPAIRTASIYKAQRFSDHAPLVMLYDLTSL